MVFNFGAVAGFLVLEIVRYSFAHDVYANFWGVLTATGLAVVALTWIAAFWGVRSLLSESTIAAKLMTAFYLIESVLLVGFTLTLVVFAFA